MTSSHDALHAQVSTSIFELNIVKVVGREIVGEKVRFSRGVGLKNHGLKMLKAVCTRQKGSEIVRRRARALNSVCAGGRAASASFSSSHPSVAFLSF